MDHHQHIYTLLPQGEQGSKISIWESSFMFDITRLFLLLALLFLLLLLPLLAFSFPLCQNLHRYQLLSSTAVSTPESHNSVARPHISRMPCCGVSCLDPEPPLSTKLNKQETRAQVQGLRSTYQLVHASMVQTTDEWCTHRPLQERKEGGDAPESQP